MALFFEKMISSVLQIILFLSVPIVWWFITARKQQNFIQWIGLKKVENAKESKIVIWISVVSISFVSLGTFILNSLEGVETAVSEFEGMGICAVPGIVVYAGFNTALPEELLFRGFLLKRLNKKYGFTFANITQAFFFGLLHGVMFIPFTSIIQAILIIVFTGIIAWLMGYINEKKAGGSIIPSWIIHSISNLFSGICSAFLLF